MSYGQFFCLGQMIFNLQMCVYMRIIYLCFVIDVSHQYRGVVYTLHKEKNNHNSTNVETRAKIASVLDRQEYYLFICPRLNLFLAPASIFMQLS